MDNARKIQVQIIYVLKTTSRYRIKINGMTGDPSKASQTAFFIMKMKNTVS
jgi:hypothetical protein